MPLEAEAARRFFEENFRPLRIAKLEDANGFLTGYYEPIVEGSRVATDDFKVPLYGRPRDIVHMGRKRKAEGFPNTGRVVRRLARGKYVPYFDRAAIEDGALATRNLEICYLKDANDVLFIQIQGSARVRLQDGTVLRAQLRRPQRPSLHAGRPHPDRARHHQARGHVDGPHPQMDGGESRRRRRSCGGRTSPMCSSATTGLPENEEARGAQGVPLTALRSIAVDRVLHVYGTPFFIGAELPIATEASNTKFRRLMIAQDTGSAIVGPARADIYFGAGEEAGRIAGRIKNPARFVMLMPRALDPLEAGRQMPLPEPRPKDALAQAGAARRRPKRAAAAARPAAPRPVAAAAPAAEDREGRHDAQRRSLSDDERVLWRTVTRAIAPLQRRKKADRGRRNSSTGRTEEQQAGQARAGCAGDGHAALIGPAAARAARPADEATARRAAPPRSTGGSTCMA